MLFFTFNPPRFKGFSKVKGFPGVWHLDAVAARQRGFAPQTLLGGLPFRLGALQVGAYWGGTGEASRGGHGQTQCVTF